MKTLSLTLAGLFALALVSLTQAEEARKLKLILDGSPEAGLVTIETEDLAIGETRSFTSEKGRPVLVTRSEKGLEIDVDGKKTIVGLLPGGPAGFEFHTFEDEGEPTADGRPRQRVIVKKIGGGSEQKILIHDGSSAIDIEDGEIVLDDSHGGKDVRIIRLGQEGKPVEIQDGQGQKVKVLVAPGADFAAARAKLIQSGALEGLDEAARQRILYALGGGQR